jgi:hypothetical protein
VEIPYLGFGVFQVKEGEDTVKAVKWALEAGYRHLDTATAYRNEGSVGQAIKESGVNRKDIFITTKLPVDAMKKSTQMETFETSLKLLQTDYLDLYLIHWPNTGKNRESWKILEEIYKSGRARAIGVSNFMEKNLDALLGRRENRAGGESDRTAPALFPACRGGTLRKARHRLRSLEPAGGNRGNDTRRCGFKENSVKNTRNRRHRSRCAGSCRTASSPSRNRRTRNGLKPIPNSMILS